MSDELKQAAFNSSLITHHSSLLPSVRLVHEPVGREPGHHLAQLAADALDLVLGGLGLQAAEALLAVAVLLHPLARERTRLDLCEQAAHAPLRLVVDDRGAARHVAVLGG